MTRRYNAELIEPFTTTIVMRDLHGNILAETEMPLRAGVYVMRSKSKRDEWVIAINSEAGKPIARAVG